MKNIDHGKRKCFHSTNEISIQVAQSEIFVEGFEARNRAINGDIVYVSLIDAEMATSSSTNTATPLSSPANTIHNASQPRAPSLMRTASEGTIVDDSELDDDVNELQKHRPGTEGTKAAPEDARSRKRSKALGLLNRPPFGVVVGIRERRWREFVCTLKETEADETRGMVPSSGAKTVVAIPMDRRLPRLMLRTSQGQLLEKQRLVCRLKAWPRQYRLPEGYYVRRLGPVGSIEAETRSLCLERGVWHPRWSDFLLRGLPERSETTDDADGKPSRERYSWIVPDEEVSRRKDLRQALKGCVFSIDPDGCEDVDDALSVRELDSNTWEVGVHIADVTHFVGGNSPLDREAAARATSVYLVDRRWLLSLRL